MFHKRADRINVAQLKLIVNGIILKKHKLQNENEPFIFSQKQLLLTTIKMRSKIMQR